MVSSQKRLISGDSKKSQINSAIYWCILHENSHDVQITRASFGLTDFISLTFAVALPDPEIIEL